MNANEKITRARTGLVLTSPFFASIALNLKLKEDPACPGAYTDTVVLGYNPDYIDQLLPGEVKGLICHLVLHIAMQHCFRRKWRDQRLWDMACDYAINPLLQGSEYMLPPSALIDQRFAGMEAEAIYELLQDEEQPENPEPGIGDVRDYQPQSGDSDYTNSVAQQLQQQKTMVTGAMEAARALGKLPDQLKRMIRDTLEPALPWQEILARYLTENSREDYNWKQANRRYLHAGLYLPENRKPSLGTLAVLIDTSGSIRQRELDTFAAELRAILSAFPDTEIEVIYVDSEVAHTESLSIHNLELHARGGGGTDYRPGFRHIEEQALQPACAIYFTDGCCTSFPEAPDYPVLWVISSAYPFAAPFGEVIHISG